MGTFFVAIRSRDVGGKPFTTAEDRRIEVVNVNPSGVLPELQTNDMLGFPPTEENQDEEEQIYR